MDETRFLTLADRYKEQVYAKLLDLVPDRIGRLDPATLANTAFEETLALIYMQGVAEALDAFSPAELWRALHEPGPPPELEA